MGFLGESFVDIGVDKSLAFLEGDIKLASEDMVVDVHHFAVPRILGRVPLLAKKNKIARDECPWM